jgi:predicted naringenin-chalcone synthase
MHPDAQPHPSATIAATATAVPPHVLTREDVKTYMRKVFDVGERRLDAMMTVIDNAQVHQRHSIFPIEYLVEPRPLAQTSREYQDVPQMIREKIRGVVDRFLDRSDLTREAIAAYILHPGGQKLLSYVEEQLGLCRCDTQFSWDVLGQYGNLSSATILFILHEWLTKKTMKSGEDGLAAAFSPGFSAEVLLLQWN